MIAMLRRPLFWLIVVTAIGGLLRTANLLQIEFNVDRAYPIWQAYTTLDRGAFPLIGQGTSVLFANPPLTGYLFVPLLAIVRTPLAPFMLVIALNTLGVWFTYRAARLFVGVGPALLAAWLMAVNPWVIEYSRYTWVQGLLPFLVPALYWALWNGLIRRSPRHLFGAAALLTIAAHTYLLAFVLAIPVGLALALYGGRAWRDRRLRRAIGIGAAIFIVPTVVYAAGLLADRERVAAQVSAFGENEATWRAESLDHALRLVSGRDYPAARGTDAPTADSAARQTLTDGAHVVITGLIVIGAALTLIRARGDRRWWLIALTFAAPVLLMLRTTQVVHPFYLLLTLPAGYVLAAVGAESLMRGKLARPVGVGLAVAAIAFGGLMAINSARYAQETARYPGAHGLTALSLKYALPLGVEIRESLPTRDSTIASPVEIWILAALAGGAYDSTHYLAPDDGVIIPANSGVRVTFIDDPVQNPPDGLLYSIVLSDDARIDLLALDAMMFIGSGAHTLHNDSGIILLEADINPLDNTVIQTYWRVTDPIPDAAITQFAPFAHIFDTDGNRVVIADGQVVPGWTWRAGDVQIQSLRYILPDGARGPFTVQVGQYDAARGVNALFTLADGTVTPLVPVGTIP